MRTIRLKGLKLPGPQLSNRPALSALCSDDYSQQPVAASATAPNYARAVGFAKSWAEIEASRGYGSSEKSVCPEHVDDAVLKQLISDYATETSPA